ncbi:hypothetical protein HPB51_002686 [Rhipicephalus microplus]|uniref:Uncharacterized protein n=1 Tax=Rhipicephalus microplus TaxID=6941 RepID=A0A9J6ERF9_RHIMP|nr:hypothetical protein HPB51_002686 [Rhipicephalus microplus]
MPPLRKKRKVAQGGHRKKTQQSTTFVEKAQTAQKKLTASTSRGHDHTSTIHKASACRPARDKQATLPPGQSIADCSDSEQNQKPLAPELLLKHKRGQQRKAIKVASKKSKVCALGSSRNPPADPPNEETHAAPPPANTSQLLTVKSGSGKPSAQVADHTAVSSGDKETEGRRMTRSLSKSLEKLRMRKSTVCDGASVSGHVKGKVREMPSRATVEKLGNRKRAKRRGSPPVAQEATVTSPGRPSPHSETSQVRNVSARYSSRTAPKPSGQHNTRALSRLQTEEAPTNAISKEVHKTARIGGSASAQRSLSRGAVTKTPHVQERRTQDTPESHSHETSLKAGPSSSRLNSHRRLLFKKDSLKINTLQKDTQNIQVNTRTSEQQLMSDDAARSSQSATLQGSQGSAETSSTARKIGSTGKKTARMSAPGKAANAPESRINEIGLKAGPSSHPLNWQQRLLLKKDSLKSNTLQKDTHNIQVNARTSEQLMSDDAARSSQNAMLQGIQGNPEMSSTARKKGGTGKKSAQMVAQEICKTNVLAQTSPKRHSFKRPSAETSHAEVEPSGDKTVKTEKCSQKMQQSLGITLSNREHTPGNSRSRRFRSRRQVQGRGDVLDQSPRKGHRSNRPTAETSHAEAGPSGYKAARTQKSLQEMPQSLGITPSDEEHASGSSRSYNLRSRRQSEGRGDGPQTEHVPENTARITSLAPQQRIEREKLRARPRHLWKRKAAQEPVFVVEDGEPSRRTPSSSSKGKMARRTPSPVSGGKADAATLLLSPAPLSAASSSDEGYPGKLGFHWYEKTFGMLQCEQANAVNDVESLHWKSDTEECESENDSSDVDSGEDLSVLPWHDSRSSQFTDDLEPNRQR